MKSINIDLDDRSALPIGAAGWYTVTILCLALLVSFTDRLVINLVVDPIRAGLTLTDFEISLVQGAGFAVIFALAGVPCGRLADTVNRRNVIIAGITIWSAATIACGLAVDFWSLFAARVAVGLGEAALIPAASSLIVDSFSPRRRGMALGIFSLGATFGTGTALFVGGVVLAWSAAGWFAPVPLIGQVEPWRQLFVLVGAAGLLLVPLLMLIREPLRLHSSGLMPLVGVLRQLLADNGAVLRVCLVKGALGIGDYALISWLPTLLQRAHGMTPLEAGGHVALSITASGVIASVAGGAHAHQLRARMLGQLVAIMRRDPAMAVELRDKVGNREAFFEQHGAWRPGRKERLIAELRIVAGLLAVGAHEVQRGTGCDPDQLVDDVR